MAGEPKVMHDIHAQRSVRRRAGAGDDEAIADLAERQHGVVARWQLVALGLGRGAIAERLKKKRLHHVHRGVYAVGYRKVSRLGWWLAAVLACGPGAVLSHRCAGALRGILDGWPATVDVSVSRPLSSRPRVRVHEATLPDDERTVEAGIPVTTVARTLLDLAAVLDPHQLNRALERAEALRLADPTPLVGLIARYPGRRGIANLREALKEGLRPQVTKSELERRFLTFLDEVGLPRPRTNVWLNIGGDWMEVDCVWPEQRVIAELDSRTYHQTTAAFERDRRRDRRLQAAGWRPIRITDEMLRKERAALVADVRALVSGRAAPARSAGNPQTPACQ
jgi:predicted transcriptional regulator of viral defense system